MNIERDQISDNQLIKINISCNDWDSLIENEGINFVRKGRTKGILAFLINNFGLKLRKLNFKSINFKKLIPVFEN